MISIIVPVHNVEKYLNECVESLINQTYTDLEIILIDDGSTDKSGSICDAWSQKDDRIRVIHQSSKGPGEARNIGMDIARGDYISFVDSDDYIDHSMMEKLLTAIIQNDADVSMCRECSFMDGEEPLKTPDEKYVVEDRDMFINHFLDQFRGPYTWLWNKLYKRSLIGDLRVRHFLIMEDVVFSAECGLKINKLVDIGERLYFYRQRRGSSMNSINEKKLIDYTDATFFEYEVLKGEISAEFDNNHQKKILSILHQIEIEAKKNKYKSAKKHAKEMYIKAYNDKKIKDSFVVILKYMIYKFI